MIQPRQVEDEHEGGGSQRHWRHTHGGGGFCPTKSFARHQLKPRLGWAICDAAECLEIGKYLRRVGADRTILYRNLDRTYMMDFDDTTKRHHAMMAVSAELEAEEERRGDLPCSGQRLWESASLLVRASTAAPSVDVDTGSGDLDLDDES